MTAKVRIVLVEPREAGNVGAVTRAMKNFGFDDLVIVGERIPQNSNALWWSSGAEDLLERARLVPTLQLALEDVHHSVATTSSRGRTLEIPLQPFEVSQRRWAMGEDETLAVVFGREDHGLTAAEALLCGAIAVIPTSPEFPTMNLAQAVSIFSYELTMRRESVPAPRVREVAEGGEGPPPQGLVERFHERATALLLESGFLQENNPDRVYEEMRRLASRAQLTMRETSLLLAMVRQIEWKLKDAATRKS
jgi:TrmH family RNA methyltransferase